MRIGFDIDGILAAFVPAYQRLFVRISGEDKFLPGDDVNPPCWDWPQFRGYGNDVVGKVWDHIVKDPTFWSRLAPLDGAETLAMCIADLERKHDVYFATDRAGIRPKQQTEEWLRNYIGLPAPTVLIAGDKAAIMGALRLDAYIDDRLSNIEACGLANLDEAASAIANNRKRKFNTKLFLLNRNYNQAVPSMHYTRVRSVGQMLDYLELGL